MANKKQNINDKLRSLTKEQSKALAASLNSAYSGNAKTAKKSGGKK